MSTSLSILQRQRANALVEEMQDDLDEYAARLVEAEDDNERLRADLAARDEQIAALTAERDAAREALRTYGHHDEDCPLALVAPDVDDVCECDFYAALGGGE